MQYLRLFPQNNHFFKPKRLVWQETEPKPETLKSAKEEPSWEEALESADFIKDIEQTCDTAREEGKETLECRIRSLMEGKELVQFRRFIDELGEKFLKQLPESKYRYTKETSKRLEALKEITDLQDGKSVNIDKIAEYKNLVKDTIADPFNKMYRIFPVDLNKFRFMLVEQAIVIIGN